jgi:transposase-like protein
MPWNEVDVQEQRIRFAVLAERGEETMAALCREFGISRESGYKWRRRYRAEGVSGVQERSRRQGPRLKIRYYLEPLPG